jgi:hypothetical protein
MKPFILSVLIIYSISTEARTYYVSRLGSDTNSGLSQASAWQTIEKLNSFRFEPNDQVLFRRGDAFYGGITVQRASLGFGAYGKGARPVITGLKTISDWVNLGGKIWEAPAPGIKASINLVLRNGMIQQVGRYPNADAPNSGYLFNSSATSSSITGPAQASKTNWTGAEVVFRTNRWSLDRQIVTSHSGGTLNFAPNPTALKAGFGYFFQRDARTLDKDGEWYLDGGSGKLRMYFANNDPAAYLVQASAVDTLFYSQKSNTVLTDLAFTGANSIAVLINGVSNILIRNCQVSNSGGEGITTWFCSNSTIDSCGTTNCLASGIRQRGASKGNVNLTIQNCTVNNTALIAGMEKTSGSNSGSGLLCRGGSNVQVLNNRVINSGYNALEWYGDDVNIKYNFIDSFCSVRDDGGGIYTREGDPGSPLPVRRNRNVVSNIILHGIGAAAGTDAGTNFATSVNGVYLDDGTRTVLVDSNTIAFIAGNGIHGNGNAGNIITNNIVYSAKFSISQQRFIGGDPIRGLVIRKNTFYPYRLRYRNSGINVPTPLTKEADILAMGSIDSNYYSTTAGSDTSIVTATTSGDGRNYRENTYGFSYLTNTVGIEKHSRHVVNTAILEYNAGNSPKRVSFAGTKKDIQGNTYQNSVTIPAWRGILLFPNGPVEASD